MTHPFCPGYPPPYDTLVSSYPDAQTYPPADFRTEWGPIFHRGRLDGTARLLLLGQDPAAEEAFARRILVGVAGQRTQGLMSRLGITRSYVMVNTFLYSVASQSGGNKHKSDHGIAAYRNKWLDLLVKNNQIQAVITLGSLAADAYAAWLKTTTGKKHTALHHAPLMHPTYPESASATGQTTLAAATAKLLANWNGALPGIGAALTHPDEPASLASYGTSFTPADLTPIPEYDLPPGLPAWVRSPEVWAKRTGTTAETKRATLTTTVPAEFRSWTS